MKARKLNVLDINDQNTEAFVSGAEHFSVQQIATWREAQEILAGERTILPPDLLLLDVSFDKDEQVAGASIDDAGKIVPIGPFLALPFLNIKTVMGFSPYSAHMGNELLFEYPPFLVAMGLIAAKIESNVFGSTHLSHRKSDTLLDDFLKGLKKRRAGNTSRALKIALDLYRENFLKAIQSRKLLLLNSKELIKTVQSWRKRIKNASEEIKQIEVSRELGLQVTDKNSNPDCISLSSLFADLFSWSGTWADENVINEIWKWLSEAAKYDTPFVKAFNAILKQDEMQNKSRSDERPCIDNIIKRMYPLSSSDEKRDILQLCVLFANFHVLFLKGKTSKEDVYKRLGIKNGQREYRPWFGITRTSTFTNKTVTELNVKPLNLITPTLSISDKDCCFLSEKTVLKKSEHNLIENYRKNYGKRSDPRFEKGWDAPYTYE